MEPVASTVARALAETAAQRQARIDAAVARCVMPIGEDEAQTWDAIAGQRAQPA